MEPDTIFLDADQAVAAICRDLRQYEPQTILMCEILRVLDGPEAAKREADGAYIWVGPAIHGRLKRLTPTGLVNHVCTRLAESRLSVETLAAICRRVFQAGVHPVTPSAGKKEGIAIETEMREFICRQCGQCCRELNYQHNVTAADVARWQALNREDILAWVGRFRSRDGSEAYQIWVVPGTNRIAETCPFLKRGTSSHRWVCGIHDVKPTICQQYPITRKHALMTGCRGFDKAGGRSAPAQRK